jgi:hypothetical protein
MNGTSGIARRPRAREARLAGCAADLEEIYDMQDALAFGGAAISC